jgi:hypothetical protein
MSAKAKLKKGLVTANNTIQEPVQLSSDEGCDEEDDQCDTDDNSQQMQNDFDEDVSSDMDPIESALDVVDIAPRMLKKIANITNAVASTSKSGAGSTRKPKVSFYHTLCR